MTVSTSSICSPRLLSSNASRTLTAFTNQHLSATKPSAVNRAVLQAGAPFWMLAGEAGRAPPEPAMNSMSQIRKTGFGAGVFMPKQLMSREGAPGKLLQRRNTTFSAMPSAKLTAPAKTPDVRDKSSEKVLKSSTNEVIRKIIRYGEFCQLTMDSVDLNPWSRYRDNNMYKESELLDDGDGHGHLSTYSYFEELPQVCTSTANKVKDKGYSVKDGVYLYADENTQVAKAVKKKGQDIEDGRVWIGYVGYSEAEKDIVVAWRGTAQVYEWLQDAEVKQVPYEAYPGAPVRNKQAAKPVPVSNSSGTGFLEKLVPKNVVKLFLAGGAALFATTYGGIPAAVVFAIGSILLSIFHSEELFAVVFTALYAAIAGLPIYKVLLQDKFKPQDPSEPSLVAAFDGFAKRAREWKLFEHEAHKNQPNAQPHSYQPFLRLLDEPPSMKNFAIVWGLTAAVTSLVFNTALYSPNLTPTFWLLNASLVTLFSLLPMGVTAGWAAYDAAGEGPRVHEGFWELYNNVVGEVKVGGSAREALLGTKATASTITDLIALHEKNCPGDRNLTISVTGHSLGGALAVLSAFDIVESNYNTYQDGTRVQVRAISFEAPRVGNPAFVSRFKDHQKHLKLIRVANKPDIVPDVPKAFFLQNAYYVICTLLNFQWGRDKLNWAETLQYQLGLPSAYEHARAAPGDEYILDSTKVKYLKRMKGWLDIVGNSKYVGTYHNLELNLFALSYNPPPPSGWKVLPPGVFTRDLALCNKNSDNIDPRVGIAPNWLETLSPDVGRATLKDVKPPLPWYMGALIQPYRGDKEERTDDNRVIGQGPDLNPLTLTNPDFDATLSQQDLKTPDGQVEKA